MVDLKAKPFYLNDEQITWVEETIQSMSIDEKVGQLFVHLTAAFEDETVKSEVDKMHMGAIRFNPRKKDQMWQMNYNFQKHSRIPILSAVNTESGGNGATSDGTFVGSEMKVAATNDKRFAYELGRISGREAKATGSNWAFSPIVDLVTNIHNPGISTRGFSNDPDKVLEFSKEFFRGMSTNGIACAMKHFPGDGNDMRDPHIALSVNSLSCEEWDNTYGKIYKGMIDEGVQSLMPGHIMLPSYQKYFNPEIKDEDLMPATLSKEILGNLLREKLGFNGLIVTDASHMVGLAAKAKRRDLVPGAIMAGCDMFLFFNDIEEDFAYMKEAILDGRLTEERLYDALSRILALKASVGLNTFKLEEFPSKEGLEVVGCDAHKLVTKEISRKAITLVKSREQIFPLTPKKYKRILLVSIGPKPSPAMAVAGLGADSSKLDSGLKSALEDKGFVVTEYIDPMSKLVKAMQTMSPEEFTKMRAETTKKGAYSNKQSIEALTTSYDLVICYANVGGNMRTTQRLEWAISKGGWDNPWYVNEIPTIFISFNCPFHLLDVPQVKTYINCYDAHPTTVEKLVDKLCGKEEFIGISPVDAFCGLIDTRY